MYVDIKSYQVNALFARARTQLMNSQH